MRGVWTLFHRVGGERKGHYSLAGPCGLLAVVATWAALLALGWALVFWPHVEDGFRVVPGTEGNGFVTALNVSIVTLTTVGFGDVTPVEPWLRILTPLEALLGFGLLSASISWLLLLYPVLLRRRALAYEISLLGDRGRDPDALFDGFEQEALERLYAELTSRLVTVERDLVAFPATYYFAERDPRFSLAATAPTLLALAERGKAARRPERSARASGNAASSALRLRAHDIRAVPRDAVGLHGGAAAGIRGGPPAHGWRGSLGISAWEPLIRASSSGRPLRV